TSSARRTSNRERVASRCRSSSARWASSRISSARSSSFSKAIEAPGTGSRTKNRKAVSCSDRMACPEANDTARRRERERATSTQWPRRAASFGRLPTTTACYGSPILWTAFLEAIVAGRPRPVLSRSRGCRFRGQESLKHLLQLFVGRQAADDFQDLDLVATRQPLPQQAGRGAGDAEGLGSPHVLSKLGRMLPAGEALLKRRNVQTELLGVAGELFGSEGPLVGEQDVMHVPELLLVAGAGRRLGRLEGVRMHRQ